MTLKDKLENDLKTAMKSKDSIQVAVVRMLLASIKNEELAKKSKLKDGDVIAVLNKNAKQRRESIDAFEKGGRADLVDKEKAELEIIQRYLPEQLSEDELGKIIDQAIQETGAASPQDMGKVMKAIMPKTQGRADGKVVSALVQKKLS